MDQAHLFAIGVLLAWLAGIRVYLTVFGVGLAGLLGWVDLPPALQATESWWVLGTSAVLAVAEFFADKIPGVDSAWDLLQTLARVPAGAPPEPLPVDRRGLYVQRFDVDLGGTEDRLHGFGGAHRQGALLDHDRVVLRAGRHLACRGLDPAQVAGLAICVQQGHGLRQGQAPGALDFALLINARCAEFQVQGMEVVFDQLQGEAQALVAKLGFQVQLGVAAQPRQYAVGDRAAIHPKALHREDVAGQRVAENLLDIVQFITAEQGFLWHRGGLTQVA